RRPAQPRAPGRRSSTLGRASRSPELSLPSLRESYGPSPLWGYGMPGGADLGLLPESADARRGVRWRRLLRGGDALPVGADLAHDPLEPRLGGGVDVGHRRRD